MAVILKTLTKAIDITKYVDKPYDFNDTLTGEYDTGHIIIPYISANEFGNHVDFSRRIPRFSIIEIDRATGTRSYFIESSEVVRVGEDLYEHTFKLTEPKIILGDRPIPDFAITQPQGASVSYTTESSRVTNKSIDSSTYTIQKRKLSFAVSQVSNDTDVIEERVVKEDGEYKINFSYTAGKLAGNIGRTVYVYAWLYVNDVEYKEYYFGRFWSLGWANIGTIAFTETLELEEGDEINVYLGLLTNPGSSNTLKNRGSYLTIDKKTDYGEAPLIYMDEVVDKLLRIVNVTHDPEFILDASSRARLSTILAYDDMHTEGTLKTALERIASFVKARLYVELDENGKKIIKFSFYDDMSKLDYIEPNDDLTVAAAISNDYFSGLALQNNNIVRDNYLKETLLIMGGDLRGGQITTDNIAAFTKYPIDRIKQVLIKSDLYLNAINVTPNVREKAHYDTLDGMATYENRLANNKNNHFYFVRGDNKLYGLGYTGAQEEKFIPDKTNRALYETIAAVQVRNDVEVTKWVDTGAGLDRSVKIYIEYYPMSETNAFVFKDDQSGFEQKRISRLNASDRVNNLDYLGDYARGVVNSIGGTQRALKGTNKLSDEMTVLGTISPLNERVVSITSSEYDNDIQYYATHVKDHVFISHYIGIDKDRRLVHVPRDEFVRRVDKSLNVIYLMEFPNYYNISSIKPELFLKSLGQAGGVSLAPEVAVLDFDGKQSTIFIDSSATGNSVEWYFEAQDNYSVGMQRKEVPDVNNAYYQVGVPYSDLYGNAKMVEATVKSHESINTTFPVGDHSAGSIYATLGYLLNKDAREQFALSIQTALLSTSNNIIVYSGFGKYNRMSNHQLFDIGLAILDYIPNKDDKYIDLGRIIPATNNVVVQEGYIRVTLSNEGLGYAFYERDSGELLLAKIGSEIGENKIYYKAEHYDLDSHIYLDVDFTFGIKDFQFVNISEVETSFILVPNIEIHDTQYVTLQGGTNVLQVTYDMTIDDSQVITFITTAHIQETYKFQIDDKQLIDFIILENYIQEVYSMIMTDTQYVDLSVTDYIQSTYDMILNDVQFVDFSGFNYIQQEYEYNHKDTQWVDFTGSS